MTRLRLYSGIVLLLVAAMLAGCSAVTAPVGDPVQIEDPGPADGPSQDESRLIAEEFVIQSPTFVFDGMADSLRLTDAVEVSQPYTWLFVFEFDSRQAGYGDRSDQILAQVITRHEASITVEAGEISDASLDSKWDMLEQTELPGVIDPDDAVFGPTPDFTGFITKVVTVYGGIVRGSIAAESQADKIVVKYVITIMGSTEMLGLNGEPTGFEAFEPTQQVQVWFSGPVKESFPMQVDAGKVIISRVGR